MRQILAGTLLAAVLTLAPANAGDVLTTYIVASTGTMVNIPAEGFHAGKTMDGGQVFDADDGLSSITVFAAPNAPQRTLPELLAEAASGLSAIRSTDLHGNRVTVTGSRDDRSVIRAELVDAHDVIHVVEVSYDETAPAEIKERLGYVVDSLRVAQSTTPASPDDYATPARGSKERAAMMDAARGPISAGIGQTVIFVISTLRTDGEWAFLQATPKNPDGTDIDWSKTLLADDWEADMMSDVVMVLLRKKDGQWIAVDHVIGPTDVFWYNWMESYGLPELLFNPG